MDMTNVEKLTEKLKVLTEAIKELGGGAFIIGHVPDETNADIICIVSSITSKNLDTVNVVAKTFGNSEVVRKVIETGCALSGLLKPTGGLKADKVEETEK